MCTGKKMPVVDIKYSKKVHVCFLKLLKMNNKKQEFRKDNMNLESFE